MAGTKKNKTVKRETLNNKEFAFANLVLGGKDPKEAAEELGWKGGKNGMHVVAWRLMRNPRIVKYFEEEKKHIAAKRRLATEVDDVWITQKFKEILDRCMQAQPVMRYDYDRGEMVQATQDGQLLYTFDSAGAIRAAENLAKHIGYYELDNKQKQTIIKIGTVQNIANFFFEDEEPPPQEDDILEIG